MGAAAKFAISYGKWEGLSYNQIPNGQIFYVNYKGVRVGAMKTDGELSTVFPDGTQQP